jgi:xylulokinase
MSWPRAERRNQKPKKKAGTKPRTDVPAGDDEDEHDRGQTAAAATRCGHLGTGGPKVARVDGGRRDRPQYETNELILHRRRGRRDPDDWWNSICAGTRRLLADLVPVQDIVAVSITAQWMGTVAVDTSGRHLMNAVIWMDSRGASHADAVAGGGIEIPGTGYNARKAKTWLSMTGGLPSRTGKDPVGHILWLKHERPEIYEAAATFLDVPDYLNLRLTGRACASYDSVVGYWCTDNRDLGRVEYRDELIALAGFDRAKLPELVPTCTVIGTLRPSAARAGPGRARQVVTGTGDVVGRHRFEPCATTKPPVRGHVVVAVVPRAFRRPHLSTSVVALRHPQPVLGGHKGRTWRARAVAHRQHPLPRRRAATAPPPTCSTGQHHGRGVPAQCQRHLQPVAQRRTHAGRQPPHQGVVQPRPRHHGQPRARRVRSVALNTRWMMAATERFVKKQRPDGFGHITFVGAGPAPRNDARSRPTS